MKKSMGATVVPVAVPAWIVGAYDKDGKATGATVAWTGICCSDPPCMNFSLRKATYTYAAVLERACFTLNIPSAEHAEVTDYFGLASGRDQDKFAAAGLTAVKAEHVDAPYMDEFPMVVECKLIHHLELGLHTIFIGQILDVKCEDAVLGENGKPDTGKIKPFVFDRGGYRAVADVLGKPFSMGRGRMADG